MTEAETVPAPQAVPAPDSSPVPEAASGAQTAPAPHPAGQLAGRHLLVVGLGESGLAMARWGERQGARVTVVDDREAPARAGQLREQAPQARLLTATLDAALLDAVDAPDLLAWSPGLSPVVGDTAALYQAALARGLPIFGELDFFAAELARRAGEGYRPRRVAITGTNGKTTVTEMAGHLAREAGIDAVVAGNISPAMLDALADRIDGGALPALWILELSSFQLATAAPFACDASVILNVTEDHLDWHGSMAHYRASKLRIHAASGCRIANADDRLTDPAFDVVTLEALAAQAAALAAGVSDAAAGGSGTDSGSGSEGAPRRRGGRVRAPKVVPPPPADRVFSNHEPRRGPAFGLVRDGGLTWLVEALVDDEPSGRRKREAAGGFRLNQLMPVDALRLTGAHNHANVLATLSLLRAVDVSMVAMLRGLRDFETAAHRFSHIATIADVLWYNDSKGTNVGATVAALEGVGRPAVLIAGGIGKGQDFSPLAPAVRRHARAVVLIGRDAQAIAAALAETGVPIEFAPDLTAAAEQAARLARPADAVLLSPACASFDMFRSYVQRGQAFIDIVRDRAEAAGQVWEGHA